MPARTGEQFLKGLRGPREVWVDGERISDVVDHPKLRGAAHALAEVFDLHHQHPDILLMPDRRDRRANSGQPHDPALARGSFAPRQGVAPRRRVFGRADGPHARLHERHLCGLRRQSRRVGQPRQRGRRRAAGHLPEVLRGATSRSPTRSCSRPSTRRWAMRRRPAIRMPCARSPTPSTASSCAARASWRPWRRSPTRSRSIPPCRCRPAPTTMRCRSASP